MNRRRLLPLILLLGMTLVHWVVGQPRGGCGPFCAAPRVEAATVLPVTAPLRE